MKPFSNKKKLDIEEFMLEKGISRPTKSQREMIRNANRSGKKTTRQAQQKDLQVESESDLLKTFLIQDEFKETVSNTFSKDNILIRITEGKGCDVALSKNFVNWAYSKLNNYSIVIPQTESEYEDFLTEIEDLISDL